MYKKFDKYNDIVCLFALKLTAVIMKYSKYEAISKDKTTVSEKEQIPCSDVRHALYL